MVDHRLDRLAGHQHRPRAVTAEIIGAEAAFNDLQRWAKDVAPAVAKAAEPLGQRVAGIVRNRVPVDSGALRGSVDTRTVDDGVELSIGEGLDYAGWIEFGGSRGREYVPSGRYLYPAAVDSEDEFTQVADSTATDSIGRFSWSKPPSAA
jgi:hypothetical protein